MSLPIFDKIFSVTGTWFFLSIGFLSCLRQNRGIKQFSLKKNSKETEDQSGVNVLFDLEKLNGLTTRHARFNLTTKAYQLPSLFLSTMLPPFSLVHSQRNRITRFKNAGAFAARDWAIDLPAHDASTLWNCYRSFKSRNV